MGSLRRLRASLCTLLTGFIIATSNPASAANAWGTGAIYGDLLQYFFEALLSIPTVAKAFDYDVNKKPFLVPQAKSHAITTSRNRAVNINLRADHYVPQGETQPLVFSISEPPLHGVLEGQGAHLTYVPDSGYTGLDKFKFTVDDSAEGFTEGTIDIKISGSYTTFESGQVRPLALNSAATRLYALNTPDGKLEIYDVTTDTPKHLHSVAVGLEPVAIALRNDEEAWVVNTLSDNVSIVNLSAPTPYVKQTVQVGDEPQDVVFAGPQRSRAFITTAHRGQNSPVDFAAQTAGIGRADVWVFDTQPHLKFSNIVTLFGMPPRGLAVSPDGHTVYAGIFKSGNQTAIVTHNYRLEGPHSTKNSKPAPNDDAAGVFAPNTGLIAKYDGQHWVDSQGLSWDPFIHHYLPDYDVFEIDAMADSPMVIKQHPHVGTALFNLTVNPKTGTVYVSNLEARNELRFEGKGERSPTQTLRGRFIENRITVIKGGKVTPRELNSHLNDSNPDGSFEDNAASLALPLQMQIDAAGKTLYVAAYGSSKIGIFDVAELEAGTFSPSPSHHIEVTGGGPSGVVLDEKRDRLYVLTRFDNGLSTVQISTKKELHHLNMYNPEPDFIVKGRPFLYDARFSSGRGDSACGSCHLFGDNDGIAWDLGNPDATWKANPRPYVNLTNARNALRVHHPLKGPMVTQSLRGMEFQGPQHWRGDRTGEHRFHGESLERAAFKEFREAFPGLLGKAHEPTEDEMNAFADFALQLRYPPNPNRNLDDGLTAHQLIGEDTYFNLKTTGFTSPKTGDPAMMTCNGCHELEPDIERFGTNTLMSFEGTETSQDMKIAHLRSLYTKVGMFGQKLRKFTPTYGFMGDQVSGYGFSHDGAADTIRTFLSLNVFHVPEERMDPLIDFLMVFPTGMAPIIGQQVTLNASQPPLHRRIDLMIDQALAHQSSGDGKPKCDLVVHGLLDNQAKNWLMTDSGQFMSDNPADAELSDTELRALAAQPNNSLTYLCAPPGSGYRLALDRDEDGIYNQVDSLNQGKADTKYNAANMFAEPEQDQLLDAKEGGFEREAHQIKFGHYPSFLRF